jgi:ubiquinol-cytochrome c reductase cytochrome b subunit
MSLWGEFCPKCVYNYFDYDLSSLIFSKIRSEKRIGAHNYDILSIIFGSLLGDAYAEKHGNGTRIVFYQENTHKDYLLWLHTLISSKGYCSNKIPVLSTRLYKYGKLRNIIRFKTFTYSSFNWIQECWYINNKKVLPQCINKYLSPLALTFWIMDEGTKVSSGIKLANNNFDLKEVIILCKILKDKYDIVATANSAGDTIKKEYVIYIHKESMVNLSNIVLPYMHPSMKYKLNNYL